MDKTIGIIAEFNPFHNGHEYLIREAKKLSGADHVLVVMSGDYVQRGTPAICSKYIRTEMALAGGADAVIEMPVSVSTGSSRRFAEGAIAILQASGVVDELWFGSEEGSIEPFLSAAAVLSDESSEFQKEIKDQLKKGLSYPAAREKALRLSAPAGGEHLSLSGPNNILGLEYCIALKKSHSRIVPRTLPRVGCGHNSIYAGSSGFREAFLSSTAIRSCLLNEGLTGSIQNSVPPDVFSVCQREKNDLCVSEDDFSDFLSYQLIKEDAESLTDYLDVTGDLAERIVNNRMEFISFSQYTDLLKTKNTTRTQISRALLHIVLGITPEDFHRAVHPAYLRLLGFRREGEALLKQIKANSAVPLVTRPKMISGGYDRCDLFASNLYESVSARKAGRHARHEYENHIIII